MCKKVVFSRPGYFQTNCLIVIPVSYFISERKELDSRTDTSQCGGYQDIHAAIQYLLRNNNVFSFSMVFDYIGCNYSVS